MHYYSLIYLEFETHLGRNVFSVVTVTGKINVSVDLAANLKSSVNLTDKKYNLLSEYSVKIKMICLFSKILKKIPVKL